MCFPDTTITQVTVSDADAPTTANGQVDVSIDSGGSGKFTVIPRGISFGRIITDIITTPDATFDYDATSAYTLIVSIGNFVYSYETDDVYIHHMWISVMPFFNHMGNITIYVILVCQWEKSAILHSKNLYIGHYFHMYQQQFFLSDTWLLTTLVSAIVYYFHLPWPWLRVIELA